MQDLIIDQSREFGFSEELVGLRILKHFTFEHKWLLEDEFMDGFSRNWESLQGNHKLPWKLSKCSQYLRNWAGTRFNQLGKKIDKSRKELNALMTYQSAKDNHSQIRKLEHTIEKLSEQEEIHWKQRARVNWLQNGDMNT